jgi:PKD domain
MRLCLLFALLMFTLPTFCVASVSISEIAWMGDTTSANNEWIELYNSGEAVVVDGWTLSDGMNLSIALSGTIPSSSYVVLERNRSTGVYLTGTPFLVYTGALVNTGATLVLRRADTEIEDQVAGGENWETVGGDNVTKETAQYTTSGWRTGIPTPEAQNTATIQNSGNNGSTTTPTTSSGSKPTGSSKPETVKLILPQRELVVRIEAQKTAYVNQAVSLVASSTGLGPTLINSLQYNWNFGDLTVGTGQKPTHTYRYPGTYFVTVEAAYAKHRQIAQFEITVLPVTLSLARGGEGEILLHNNAPYDVDVSGYRLRGRSEAVFPPRSVIVAKGTVTIPPSLVSSLYDTPLFLADASAKNVAVWPPVVSVAIAPATVEPLTARMTTAATADAPAVVALVPEPSVDETTTPIGTTSMALMAAPVSPEAPSLQIPAYVYTSFEPNPVVDPIEADANSTATWPYVALAVVLGLTIVGLLVTSPNMSSTPTKISPWS